MEFLPDVRGALVPPRPRTQFSFGATFNPWNRFNRNLERLRKASVLLKRHLGWMAPEIRAIGKGIKNAHDIIFKFPDFIYSDSLLRLLGRVKVDSPRGLAYLLSYLFAIRVPSETIRHIRAFADGRLTEFIQQIVQALIVDTEPKRYLRFRDKLRLPRKHP